MARRSGEAGGGLIAGRRGIALAAAELLGLTALAIAQPIFDGLQRSTFAFPPLRIDGWDMVLLAAILVLVPPALLLAVELIAGLFSRTARGWVHLAWIGLLAALLCWQAVVLWGAGGPPADPDPGRGPARIRRSSICASTPRAASAASSASPPRSIAGLFLFTSPIVYFTFAASPDIPSPWSPRRRRWCWSSSTSFRLPGCSTRPGGSTPGASRNFAALQRHSDWFRDTVTVADSTEQAVPAILSGELPDPDGVATYTDHPGNLFTLLGSSYRTNISESGTYLCPPEHLPDAVHRSPTGWPRRSPPGSRPRL